MGDIAEMMLDGTLCEGCGEFMGDAGDGYVRYCAGCRPKDQPKQKTPAQRAKQRRRNARRRAKACAELRREMGL